MVLNFTLYSIYVSFGFYLLKQFHSFNRIYLADCPPCHKQKIPNPNGRMPVCCMKINPYAHHKWSILHLIFILLIILQSLFVGVIMLKQHGMEERLLLDHAKKMMQRLASGAIYNTSHHLQSAEHAARVTRGLIENGVISPDSPHSFERYLLEMLKNRKKFSGLSYGDQQGNFLYVSRQPATKKASYLTKNISFPGGIKQETIIERDADFNLLSQTIVDDRYDPRTRPWYAAYKKNSILWTPPYIFYTSGDPGITISIPIKPDNTPPQGAFGVDIEINTLSDFLADRQISPNSFAFIVAQGGAMAAHSDINVIKKYDRSGHPKLLNIKNLVNQPILTRLWSQIERIDTESLAKGIILDLKIDQKKYLAVALSFPKDSHWPWVMSVVAPEDDFVGIFRRAKRQELIQALLYSIAITLILFLLAGRFLKPVRRILHSAYFDPMTNLYNRRAFFENSTKIVNDAQTKNTPLCLGMIDVDNFKAINDTHGHGVGDESLIAIAGRLHGSLSNTDIIGRYGGEEFILLLKDTDAEQGLAVCQRLRMKIADTPIFTTTIPLHITISIGVAPLSLEYDLQSAISLADQALLQAKKTGKNKVILSQ